MSNEKMYTISETELKAIIKKTEERTTNYVTISIFNAIKETLERIQEEIKNNDSKEETDNGERVAAKPHGNADDTGVGPEGNS